MDCNFEQPPNALWSIIVTEEGISMFDNDLQSEYPLIVDYQYYILKTVEK